MTQEEIDIVRSALFIANMEGSAKSKERIKRAMEIMDREYKIKQMELRGPFTDVSGNVIEEHE